MVTHPDNIHLIIAAAGSGIRFGGPLPKQFCMLGDKPVICHTIDRCLELLPEASVTVVICSEHEELWRDIASRHHYSDIDYVFGGATRAQSIFNALNHIKSLYPRHEHDGLIVLVHDAARPFIDSRLITGVINPLLSDSDVADGTIPCVPLTDSIRMMTPDGEEESVSVNRAMYRAVQTPQGFVFSKLLKAYRNTDYASLTDDASVMEAAGYTHLRITPGSSLNFKITNPEDIARAQEVLKCFH